jgi:NAD(P)-dependent dehydrogenase (short-subunit alcohol dehydrogenase family)
MADGNQADTPKQPTDPGSEAELQPSPDWRPRYPGSGRLEGKVALISGADSGIGRAVAALFAREGADIAILYLGEEEDKDAQDTAAMVRDEGGEPLLIAGDLGDADFCRAAVEQVIERFGRLDIVVNNAGEQHPAKDIEEISEDQFIRTFQTNVFGMFYLTKAARPHLGDGACIINTTSVTSYKGSDELLDYSSTKGAITAFTRALAAMLVEDGIRVNGVAPGPIWTPLNPMGGASKEKLAKFGKARRWGAPASPMRWRPAICSWRVRIRAI